MGFVEIISTNRTVVRIEDGVLTKGELRYCDGHGCERSAINGKWVSVGSDLTLWLCEECDNPGEKWADKKEGVL